MMMVGVLAAVAVLKGPFPLLVTPWTEKAELDVPVLVKEAEYVDGCGVGGVIWPTANEVPGLDAAGEYEKGLTALAERFARAAAPMKSRLTAICPGQTSAEALRRVAFVEALAKRTGAKMAILARPPDDATNQVMMADHYRALAKTTTLPVIIQTYNAKSPQPDVKLLVDLAREYPSVFGWIKEESPGLQVNDRMAELLSHPEIHGVFSGWGAKAYVYQGTRLGTCGMISQRPAYASLFTRVWQLVSAGKDASDPELAQTFAKYLYMINLGDVFGTKEDEMRGPHLYVLQRLGIFRNRLTRRGREPSKFKLENFEMTDRMKAEIDARMEYALGVRRRRSPRQEALDAMDCTFTVCGIRHHFADRKIDWSLSPTYNNYKEWPFQFARHTFLRPLADYYLETGDERAAQTFVEIVTDFIDRVPPPPEGTSPYKTLSWRTLDTGIRASVWVGVLPTFAKSPAVTEAFREKLMRSLTQHARRLVPDVTRNNWRMAELSGLLRIADAFPQLEGAAEWKKIAEEGLMAQLRRQVYPDGFQFELSTGYHSFLHHNYTPFAKRYLARGEPVPPELRETLCKSYAIYEKLMRPDGLCPALNDAPWPNARGFLKTACELFPERQDFRWIVSHGKEGERPDFLSLALPYAGTVVMRDSWEPDAVWGCVDMSPFGVSHQHEDKLSFVMYAYGKDMLVEAGNYDYDKSEMRKYVLSTRSHNTIRIDGKDQNARRSWAWRPEMLNEKAELEFSTTPARDFAKAAFRLGYGGGPAWDGSVTHVRTVEFLKGPRPRFVITDELTAADGREHSYEQLWHLETCKLKLGERDFVADFGDGVTLRATFASENGVLADLRATKKPELQGWLPIRPSGPHEHRPIHTPVLKGRFSGTTTIRAVFEPGRDDRPQKRN